MLSTLSRYTLNWGSIRGVKVLLFSVYAASSILCVGQLSISQEFEGKVIGVKDGDTIEVLYDSIPVRIRLAHIDCPESGQPYGSSAKKYLSDLCYGRTVTVRQTDRPDKYGRTIAAIYIGDECLNLAMVRSGMAWHFKKYSTDEDYAVAELAARESQIGLWADKDPTAPWEWRRIGRGGN